MTLRTPCPDDPQTLARDEKIVELLRELVQINTEHAEPAPGAPYGKGCARALDRVLAECADRGFDVHRVDEKIAWAQVGERGPLAAFPVHLDVVPATGAWTHDPYAAEVVDGVMYGRGCMDDKIGGALMIELIDGLAREYAEAGRELPLRLRIIFGTDEETGMSDMRGYCEAGEEQPRLGWVPDAGFPAVRGEKARLHVVVDHAAGAGCDGAPAAPALTLAAGTMVNVVPDHARALVPAGAVDARLEEALLAGTPEGIEARRTPEGIELVAHGKSAHGSTPEHGSNAAAALVSYLVFQGVDTPSDLQVVDRLFCRDLTGAAFGANEQHPTFGGTSMNLGTLALGADGTHVELDFRFAGLAAEELLARLRAALPAGWEVRVAQEKPVHEVPADDPCLKALLAAYGEVTGRVDAEASVMAGGTYASFLPALCVFGPKLEGAHSGAHGVDEHVAIDDIRTAAAIYDRALRNIADLAASWED